MTTKYIARIDGQVVGKRTTKDRTYTHAVIVRNKTTDNLAVLGWCGRHDLAQNLAATVARYNSIVLIGIVPAEVVAPKPKAT